MAGRSSDAAERTTLEVKGDLEIVITRTFDAPAGIVFAAWTRPELVRRWWAPASLGVTIVSCDADVRVGGSYRYVLHHAGSEFAFSGRYTEVAPPSRIAYTQVFEPTASGAPPGDGDVLVTVTFEDDAGRTHVVSHTQCPSRDVRDGIIASGMEHGMRECMEQLDALVASLR
jgi:uncharacterized protein YndB with AHSA1/START domain